MPSTDSDARPHPRRTLLVLDSGYTAAFVVSAVITALAAVVALAIPRSTDHRHVHVGDEVGAAGPLPDAALAVDPA